MSVHDLFIRHPELLTFMDPKDENGKPVGYDFSDCWSVLNPNGPIEEKDVAAAIIQFNGNISMVARVLLRSRGVMMGYIQRNMDLYELLEEVEQTFLDTVEWLYKNDAMSGDGSARKFFLTTKAKDRGYVTRTETTGKNGDPIENNVTLDPEKLKGATNAALKDLLNAAANAVRSNQS